MTTNFTLREKVCMTVPSLKEDRGVSVEGLIEFDTHNAQPKQTPTRPLTHS
ncbi:hypothetical protein [Pseudomonas massiliensis]|uniref:hypothetical protein n=1 Tax=Pseudomonas massiliensis TaxID=522492 RepID=UPI0012F904D4|nr:hypothetical protein [Pseudomonas massiliensis]